MDSEECACLCFVLKQLGTVCQKCVCHHLHQRMLEFRGGHRGRLFLVPGSKVMLHRAWHLLHGLNIWFNNEVAERSGGSEVFTWAIREECVTHDQRDNTAKWQFKDTTLVFKQRKAVQLCSLMLCCIFPAHVKCKSQIRSQKDLNFYLNKTCICVALFTVLLLQSSFICIPINNTILLIIMGK